jgi:hypothetical protein
VPGAGEDGTTALVADTHGIDAMEDRKARKRSPLTIMLVQPVVMVAIVGGGSMLPLGLIVFAVLAIPAIVLARTGARLNRA